MRSRFFGEHPEFVKIQICSAGRKARDRLEIAGKMPALQNRDAPLFWEVRSPQRLQSTGSFIVGIPNGLVSVVPGYRTSTTRVDSALV